MKQLRETAHAEVEQAVRTREISIHKAWQWSQESPKKQLENLRLRRLERGIKKKARALVAKHLAKLQPSTPNLPPFTMSDLIRLLNCLSTMSLDESAAFGTVAVATLDVPGKGIYMTPELVRTFKPPQEELIK